jgi:hypothetical protein
MTRVLRMPKTVCQREYETASIVMRPSSTDRKNGVSSLRGGDWVRGKNALFEISRMSSMISSRDRATLHKQ